MSKSNRRKQTNDRLMAIAKTRGWIYTLGLLIGIVSRLSHYDLTIYKEIEDRYNDINSND